MVVWDDGNEEVKSKGDLTHWEVCVRACLCVCDAKQSHVNNWNQMKMTCTANREEKNSVPCSTFSTVPY